MQLIKTRVSVFGEPTTLANGSKKIEFIGVLRTIGTIKKSLKEPKHYDNVQLLKSRTSDIGYDLIMAWDDTINENIKEKPSIYLGYWNDGIV